jgi:hypothetical protein
MAAIGWVCTRFPTPAALDAEILPAPAALFAAAFAAYRALPGKGKPQPWEWTVLAAFVAEEAGGSLRCVSLATGTKCVGASGMCARGLVVNDCHAEVLARRALQRALLLEAEAHARHCGGGGGGGCALPARGCLLAHGEGERRALLRLRPGVRLHLCITDAPCGEAHEYADCGGGGGGGGGGEGSGARRTGAKPVAPPEGGGGGGGGHPPLRTKSGRSDLPPHRRTRSLCCSDKVARWVGVGLQGALLAALLCAPLPLASVAVCAGGGGGGGGGAGEAAAVGEALHRALAGPRAAPCHAAARAAALRACGEGDPHARALGGAALRAAGGGECAPFEHGPAREPPAARPGAGGGRKRAREGGEGGGGGGGALVPSPLSLAAFAPAPAPSSGSGGGGGGAPPMLAEALLGVAGRLMGSTAGSDPQRAASALCKARAGAEWARVAAAARAAGGAPALPPRGATYGAAKMGEGALPLSYAAGHREVARAWLAAEGGAFAGWPRCDRAAWEGFSIGGGGGGGFEE